MIAVKSNSNLDTITFSQAYLSVKAFFQRIFLFFSINILVVCSAQAQQQTIFCLADGLQISVQTFETKDGKFLLHVAGAAAPLEYPASAVKGINVPCQSAVPVPQPVHFGIYGSNTIGERLMPLLIEAFSKKRFGVVPSTKSTAVEEQEITLRTKGAAGTQTAPAAIIDFRAHGSGTFAAALIDNKAQIGMASRRINADEIKAIDDKYHLLMTLPGNEHVLALDGLAVIVNQQNSVKALTLEQIAGIYSGRFLKWSDVGGADRLIHLYRRDDKSGTTDTFKNLVLAPFHLAMSTQAKMFESSEVVSSSVTEDVDGIGYIGLPYVNKNTALTIASTCGINGTANSFSIKTEEYPLSRRLYLYTLGAPSEAIANELLQFAKSDEAQKTIIDGEFIDQAVVLQDPGEQRDWAASVRGNPQFGLPGNKDVPGSAARAFADAINRYHRTSIVFRFERGSSVLDTRATQDIARAARFLGGTRAAKALIVGFADANGSWSMNAGLAHQRALQVVHELSNFGVNIPSQNIRSFSYMVPVACNDSESGQSKNRRVELWLAD